MNNPKDQKKRDPNQQFIPFVDQLSVYVKFKKLFENKKKETKKGNEKKLNLSFSRFTYNVFAYFISFIIVLATILAIFNIYYINRLYPGISVAGISLAGLDKHDALALLKSKVMTPDKISVLAKDNNFELSLQDIGFTYDFDSTINEAYSLYRQNNLKNILLKRNFLVLEKANVKLKFNYDKNKLEEYLEILSSQTSTVAQQPEAALNNGVITIYRGTKGDLADKAKFRKDFEVEMSLLSPLAVRLNFNSIDPTLSSEEAGRLKERAENLIGKRIDLTFEDTFIAVNDEQLIYFLNAKEGFDSNKINEFIKKEILPKIDRDPQNAVFSIQNGKVTEFKPARDGVIVKRSDLNETIIRTITLLEKENSESFNIAIPVDIAKAKITNKEVNNLGIDELLGKGSSRFRGSISSRVFNIALASSKINGALIAPGDVLSFNDTVGDISQYTGYKQAYVIKDGKTILGDGGGVCQVSTTLFRAALNSALPILERHPHSYRVYYYEQDSFPGLDATVYAPTSDLKILNNTPAYILLQTKVDEKNFGLSIEIYGTKDSRTSTIEKPKILSSTPPPEDLYIDDPTLPLGEIKQIEHSAWGSKVSFYYKIEKGDDILFEKTFYSNYQPWQSVYLRGTKIP